MSLARSLDRSSRSYSNPLNRVDPVFAAAAAAAVMNAGLIPPPTSTDLANLSLASGSGSSNTSAAAVAAVAAAAMNAAAMAAALGVGVPSKQSSQASRSLMGSSQSSSYRSILSASRNMRALLNTRQNSNVPRLPRVNSQTQRRDKDSAGQSTNRFPHHLDHRDPEDDPSATRTLFVGNLMPEITEADLRMLFERYGFIEDIDIKRREPESGVNAYAFIRFVNLDMAHRAKVDMSGQLIGQFTCKIGYGKVVPTRCLWVGGLGPWITYPAFAALLDEFGPPERIIWPSGKNYANVLFPSVEQAIIAAETLRGYPLGGNDKRIRVDFTDESHMTHDPLLMRRKTNSSTLANSEHTTHKESFHTRSDRDFSHRVSEEPSHSQHRRSKREHDSHRERSFGIQLSRAESSHKTRRSAREVLTPKRRVRNSVSSDSESASTDVAPLLKIPKSPKQVKKEEPPSPRIQNIPLTPETAVNVEQLANCLPVAWDGTFFLKSSNFPCRMHILRGDQSLVDQFMSCRKSLNSVGAGRPKSSISSPDSKGEHSADDSDQLACLRITQRMKLDPVKLEDVSQRINTAGNSGFCVLLAVPSPTSGSNQSHLPHNADSVDIHKQPQRPLRNLIAYLRTKDSAGVVLLNPLRSNLKHNNPSVSADGLPITGVLHAFPPCGFAFELLQERAVRLQKEYAKDDHLVILLIRSTGSL
ncbi:unnamed protein product [Calicophoron daubneyi]